MSVPDSCRPLARIFFPFYPDPPNEGAFQVVMGQIVDLQQTHRVELVVWLKSPRFSPAEFSVRTLKIHKRSRLVRVLGSFFSEYSSTEIYHYPSLAAPPSFERAELEIFHYSFALSWLRKLPKTANRRVMVFHNIEADLLRERAHAAGFIERRMLLHNERKLRSNELACLDLVDEAWFLSKKDLAEIRSPQQIVTKQTPPTFPSEIRERRRQARITAKRAGPLKIGLIGALDFKPNRDSAEFVLRTVAPHIADLDCEILIAGKNAPHSIKALTQDLKNVKLLGFVEDIEDFWTSLDLMLVPHISGSGVRIKLVEALASGVPVIANHAAVEALPPTDDPNLAVIPLSDFPTAIRAFAQKRSPR